MRALLCGATVALSMASTAAPARAAADLVVSPGSTYTCQVGNLTISSLAPLNVVATTATWSTFAVNASGTCSTPFGTAVPMILSGGASTIDPTCAAIQGVGGGSLTLNGMPYGGDFALVQPGAAGAAVLTMTTFGNPGGNLSSVFALNISPASLQACLLNGATSVDYVGTAVITFT